MSVEEDDLIFQKTCGLLDPYNRKRIKLSRSTEIVSDLEVDSVAVFDLIMEIEDSYDITFPMEMIEEMKSIGDIVDTIRSMKAAA
ncbi:MAG: acyl carrier protein [Pseudomonadota bacterium]